MKLTRNITIRILSLFDNLVPPFLRDSKLFMFLPFRIVFGKKADVFFSFKEKAAVMSEKEFYYFHEKIDKKATEREVDLTGGCIEEILKQIKGKTILEAGCGVAFLSNKLQKAGYDVTAVDIIISKNLREKYPKIKFNCSNIEYLPFKDKKFETVISTHTLEHVQNLSKTISELKRVCSKRLIIVVPKQRPYKYTFDSHINFFPYKYSLLQVMKPSHRYVCKVIDGDIFYLEDLGS